MADDVRASYDAMAVRYAAFALDDLDRVPADRTWLAAFAELAARRDGVVADLGCGPGHVVNHLSALGLAAVGYDLSAEMVVEARRVFPHLRFEVGDLAALGEADSSLGGIVARYSLIHVPPSHLGGIFAEWSRALEPGAPVLVSFFAAPTAEAHGSPFDHAVVTAYQLFPATIAAGLGGAGFGGIEVGTRHPIEGERPLDHGTVLAVRSET